ncbi:MAG: 50S ribosomal protein L21 [Bacilli bacterium]
MYAVIETGGKQLKVAVGEKVYVEKLNAEVGSEVVIDKVLFINDEKSKVGTPYIKGATVNAKVEKHGLGKKIKVFTYKAKTTQKRMLGHRQPYTLLTITAINS